MSFRGEFAERVRRESLQREFAGKVYGASLRGKFTGQVCGESLRRKPQPSLTPVERECTKRLSLLLVLTNKDVRHRNGCPCGFLAHWLKPFGCWRLASGHRFESK